MANASSESSASSASSASSESTAQPDNLLSHLRGGNLLEGFEGNILDGRPKRQRQPMHRCSRCGCWASPGNSRLQGGLLWCGVCSGGATPRRIELA